MKWQTTTHSCDCKDVKDSMVGSDCDASAEEKGLLVATKATKQVEKKSERRCYFPIRLMVAILAGFGVFNTNTLRLNISLALVAMVNETALLESSSITMAPTRSQAITQMCRMPESGPLELGNLSALQYSAAEQQNEDGPFVWDEATRGALLSAYFWGNVVGQIPGGLLADRFGGKSSFGLGIFVSSVVTLMMPAAAFYDVKLVFALRVLCGFAQGMALPALYSLLVHWVPHDEKSRLTGLTYSGVSLGKVVVFPISGILCDSNFLGGWPAVFYVFGTLGIVWSTAWYFLVHNDPSEDPKVSKQELIHIQDNVSVKMASSSMSTRKRKINWRKMVTSGPLWALFLAYFSSSWGAQILLTMLPSYLKFAMGFDMKSSGMVNGLPHIVAVVVSLVASCCADMLQNSKTLSPTNSRKLFAGIAMLGPMVCMLGVTLLECDRVGLVMLLTLSVSIAAVNSGGLFINEMDLSMKLAGTLKGMTNFASNLAGIIAPYAAGMLVLNNASLTEWNKVFYLSAAILFVGATTFLLFGSADDQDFCDYDEDEGSDTDRIVSENNNYRSYGSTNEQVESSPVPVPAPSIVNPC